MSNFPASFVLPGVITMAALIVYTWTSFKVGGARSKFKVPAPQTTGNADFERYLRVQMNTLENMVVFLPALWAFTFLVSEEGAFVLGSIWVIGRVLFALGYYSKASRRELGFIMCFLTQTTLLLGSSWALYQLFKESDSMGRVADYVSLKIESTAALFAGKEEL